MDKIKIGQIGVGHAHASGKMQAYRASKEYEVVGIVEPDEKLRASAQKNPVYKDLRWMTREQLLNVPGLQAVAVETSVRNLLSNAEACIDAGKHIHLDKPAGSSLPHFKRILTKATAKHLCVQMGYMYRYNPAVLMLRDFLKKGWLGTPFEVHTVMSKVVNAASRKRLAEYPGGMMFELACHIIDLTIGVLGKPKRVTPYSQHASSLKDSLLDNMLAVLEYPKALATVKTSAMEVEGFARRQFTVCGTAGSFHIQPLDRPDVWLALSRPREKYRKGVQDIKIGPYQRYVGDAKDFAKIIRGEKDSDFQPSHDLAVQETVLRACGLPIDR
ncbi:MAG: Gfo/Idh/MocA family oxidoreductase [Planctomycetaceae bacterium]